MNTVHGLLLFVNIFGFKTLEGEGRGTSSKSK